MMVIRDIRGKILVMAEDIRDSSYFMEDTLNAAACLAQSWGFNISSGQIIATISTTEGFWTFSIHSIEFAVAIDKIELPPHNELRQNPYVLKLVQRCRYYLPS
jgi:hypothetical protein